MGCFFYCRKRDIVARMEKTPPIRYFDIHSHFNLPQFEADLPAAIEKMEEEGVATICVGTDLASSKRAIEIASMSPNIWATVGQHPTDTDEAFQMAEFEKLAAHPKVVAIGECGLDFFRTPKEEVFERQLNTFSQQILLAKKIGKPLMIHARPSKSMMDAYEETINILSNFPQVRANFHFFVGNANIAKKALEAGYTMSFDGPITFSHDYDEVIKMLPIENIMAETDSPFAAPEPYRKNTATGISGRAEPWMVREVVGTIAKIRGEDQETVRIAMLENTKRFFGIALDN